MRKMFASLRARILLLIAIPFAVVLALTIVNSLGQHKGQFDLVSRLIELALLVLAFAAAWIGSESLFGRRIAALAGAAEKLGKGNLAARVGLEAKDDEIGLLAQSFDRMARELQTKQTELSRTVRALRVLSAGNRALAHANEGEQHLLAKMCQAIGEAGGYGLVWIGYAEKNAEQSIRPAAQWGSLIEWDLENSESTWSETEGGQTPSGKAIRTGTPVVVKDIPREPGPPAWRSNALRSGCGSRVALPLHANGQIIGVLNICANETDAFSNEEIGLLSEAATELSFGIAVQRANAERDRIAHAREHREAILRKSLEDSLRAIADTVELRDPYRVGHQRRIAELSAAIAGELGLPEDEIHGIHLAASIYDLGRMQVPAEVLTKPSKLTETEIAMIKTHSQAGYEILKGIEYPWPIAQIVLQHHERLDGTGYPHGLQGDQILLGSRIIAVADVLVAMASHRPYRAAPGIEAALAEIERGRGTAFDPAVADACLKLFREGRFAFSSQTQGVPSLVRQQ